MQTVASRFLAVGRLIEPLPVGGLLRGAVRAHGLEAPKEREAPGIDGVAGCAVLHPRPLVVHDRACVADELSTQPVPDVGRKKLRRLELLHHRQRLGFSAGPRLVVAREREEDDETGEDRESRRQHAEDPGRTVTVREVAALGRSATNEQHRRNGDADGCDEDENAPDQIHCRIRPTSFASTIGGASKAASERISVLTGSYSTRVRRTPPIRARVW